MTKKKPTVLRSVVFLLIRFYLKSRHFLLPAILSKRPSRVACNALICPYYKHQKNHGFSGIFSGIFSGNKW